MKLPANFELPGGKKSGTGRIHSEKLHGIGGAFPLKSFLKATRGKGETETPASLGGSTRIRNSQRERGGGEQTPCEHTKKGTFIYKVGEEEGFEALIFY